MGLAAVFESKKLLAIIAVALIAVGLFADFITTVIWFSRINPFFSHGDSKTKQTHGGTAACFVFSIIAFLAIVVLAVLALFVKPLFEKISENNLLSLVCIAVIGALCVGNVIAGIVAAAPAAKSETIKDECGPDVTCESNIQCFKSYEEGDVLMRKYYCGFDDGDDDDGSGGWNDDESGGWDDGSDWAKELKSRKLSLLKKIQAINNRTARISKKIHSKSVASTSLRKAKKVKMSPSEMEDAIKKCQDFYDFQRKYISDDDGDMKPDLCIAVAVPTILFSVIEIIGIILFLVVAIPNLNSDGGNKSANENA